MNTANHTDMTCYTVFDFETSGLDPRRERIIQVGLCKVTEGKVTLRDSWLVHQNVPIDPQATRVHGLTKADLDDRGVPPAESIARLLRELCAAPACLGHNIHQFDVPFLAAEARRFELELPDTSDYIDTAALFKGWKLGLPKRPNETHRAYADRVLSIRARGLRFAIPVCLQTLHVRMDGSPLHDAGHDAYATHLIFEALKPLM